MVRHQIELREQRLDRRRVRRSRRDDATWSGGDRWCGRGRRGRRTLAARERKRCGQSERGDGQRSTHRKLLPGVAGHATLATTFVTSPTPVTIRLAEDALNPALL